LIKRVMGSLYILVVWILLREKLSLEKVMDLSQRRLRNEYMNYSCSYLLINNVKYVDCKR
jgi:hypothetical protein